MSKLFIFDFDGVICDSLDVCHDVYNALHEQYQLPKAHTVQHIKKIFELNLIESLLNLGLSSSRVNSYLEDVKKEFLDRISLLKPFDRIIDTIQDLDRLKHHLAIITSNHTDLIHSFLNKHFKSNRFSYILGADKNASKVDKIHYIREQLNFLPNQVYYVGDTKGDVIEAKAAKVNSVAVTWGYHDRLLLKTAEPDFLIDDPKELIEIQK